jgi:DNA-binding LacI/PurR family transcriptional regulator
VIETSGLPMVFAANDLPMTGHSEVQSGHADRFYRITQELMRRGHQRFGVAGIAGAGLFNQIAQEQIGRAMQEKGFVFEPVVYKELATDNRPGMLEGWQAAYQDWTGDKSVTAILFSFGDQAHVFEEACDEHDLDRSRLPMMACLGPFSTPHRRWWRHGLLWDADAVQGGKDAFGLLLERMKGGGPVSKVLHWEERSLESYWKHSDNC